MIKSTSLISTAGRAPATGMPIQNKKSKPIHLEAGKRYYIEALHHEATADDSLAVGWQLPNGEMERPIPGKRLSTFAPAKKENSK